VTSAATDRLFETNPFDFSPANRALFVESFRETAAAHYQGNAVFRAFWDDAGLKPESIQTEADLVKVPPIMVHLFKERELCSVPRDQVALTLTSSGTGGQKSQQFLSQRSLDRVKRLAYVIHRELGMVSDDKVSYLCFTYDPRIAKDLGTAFTDELLTSFTGINEVYYALQWNEKKSDFVFKAEGVVQTLKRFATLGHPVRILGFPAFLYKVLKEHDLRLHLGPKTWVQTGGGWKGFADEEIPKEDFRAFVAARLGMPPENIRDMFGMVEHGIPYCDCKRGKLHVPNFARVFIRAPRTLDVRPEGETGLIQFQCTYNDSYPAMSLLTTDYGRLGRCDCGLPGQTLEILGRAGVTKHKGCAVKAAELL